MGGDNRLVKPEPLEGSLYGDVLAGYSPAMAAFRRGMSAVDAQVELLHAIEEHRANRAYAPDIELARLDDWLLKLQPAIAAGEVSAIDQARKLSERRCKLIGIDARPDVDDAPQRVKVEFSFSASAADAKSKKTDE